MSLVSDWFLAGAGAARYACGADHPDHWILSQRDRNIRRFFAAIPRCHQHSPTGLVGFGVDADLPRSPQLAAVRAEIHSHLRIFGKYRTGIDVSTGIGRIALNERKFRQVNFIAAQDNFLAMSLIG